MRDFWSNFENLDSSIGLSGKVNANCYYILSFHKRIEGDYDEAIRYLNHAIDLAKPHKADPKQHQLFYPGLPANTSLESWLTKLQNICFYHLAILVYNLGRYQDALQRFQVALEYDPLDYKSLSYIPEVMFLGHLASFAKVVQEFELVILKIQALKPENTVSFSESREKLLAQVYLKLGNCYMQDSRDADFSPHRDLAKAERYFSDAFRLDPSSSIIAFSLAQVLHLRNREEKQRLELFDTAFQDIKSKIRGISESKILVMYYYVLAIGCEYGKIESEIPKLYTMRIYELAYQLPKPDELRVFSPLTKLDLSVADYLNEVRRFENRTITNSSSKADSSRRTSSLTSGARR